MYSTLTLSNELSLSYLTKKIGNGAFGQIYQAKNMISNEDIAIKVESKNSQSNQLEKEYNCYKLLCGENGFSKTNIYLTSHDYNILVIDLFGQNLEEVYDNSNRKFSHKTVFQIAYQMINRIKKIHSRHIIHRDLKPENFVVGNSKSNNNLIYLIDFGLSKRFRDEKTGEHIHYRDNLPFIGNARFASIYSHLGIEQSRRDDLISLSYIILYFYKGSLPWQGLKCKTISEKNKKVFHKKFSLTPEEIFKDVPEEFLEFYNYCFNLQFDDKPDYIYLKSIIKNLANKNNIILDNIFDWNLVKREEMEIYNDKRENNYTKLITEEYSIDEQSVWINE